MKLKKGRVRKIVITILLMFLFSPFVFVVFYLYNNRLFLLEAEILWGSSPFESVAFRSGSAESRAGMAVDLIESRKFIGEECSTLPNFLGPETGDYFHSDSNLTYKLTEKESANWILTFICGQSGKIERIIIRKSCCSLSQKILHWGINSVSLFHESWLVDPPAAPIE